MYVIGTAGHVDHGKSTLVRALTGIDPDRLQEEKAREMTIDLGFAWLTLPGVDAEIGVVDVPGHRDFIENMLAGVGGIDLALLVIAADEGVMPQTREHLSILNLLAVKSGLVALTKTDMIDDPDWLELVTLEVAEALEETVLDGAEIVPVSARTGAGLDDLKERLAARLSQVSKRPDNGRPRLPIDRVFSLPGFGTIVTGTLLDGRLATGDSVTIHPRGISARIRGLQSHKTRRDSVEPGSRVAVNLTGIDKDALQRGDVLAGEGVLRPTVLIDTAYRQLPDAGGSLKHNKTVKLFIGSAEVQARTRLLGRQEIPPGESGWLQLVLEQPVAALRGDRFILRRPSPPATIGGGSILDPHPGRQHRRFKPNVLERMRTLEEGTPGDLLLQKLERMEPIQLAKFKRQSGLEEGDFDDALREILENGEARLVESQLISSRRWGRLVQAVREIVDSYHRDHPLRLGISLEEVRSRLGVPTAVMGALLEAAGLVQARSLVQRPGHEVTFDPETEKRIDRLMVELAAAGINSPSVKEARAAVGDDPFYALVDLGRLQIVGEDVFYRTEDYQKFRQELIDLFRRQGRVTAAQVRDLFQTSRKYVIAFLEHLDQQKITRRVGDERELVGRL